METRRRAVLAVAFCTALGELLGCGPGEDRMELREDLVALLPYATMVEAPSEGALTPTSEGSAKVLVPWGRRLDFHLDLPRDGELRMSARFVGPHSGKLRVSLHTDGGGERPLATIDRTTAALRVALGEESGGATRLSLSADTDATGPAEGGVLLEEPAIWARAHRGRVESAKLGSLTADRQPSARPNVLIYLVDTLRPDHLGCYGYPRDVSPNVDAFAEQAVLFEYAVGQASWTKPAVGSIFTGLWPRSHGAVGRKDKLPEESTTLAEALVSAGYRTAAVLTNPNASTAFGFDQGFQDVVERSEEIELGRAVEEALRWLDSERMEEPFFLYLHTSEPHHPYLPEEPFLDEFAPDSAEVLEIIRRNPRREIWDRDDHIRDQLIDLYDAEIAASDASFGELVAFLKERNLFESTLLVFVSDHGEEFLEHRRWGHGRNLHVEELNVALLLKFPGQISGFRVSEPVQHIDLFPTILENVGITTAQPSQGRVLGTFEGGKWSSLLGASEAIFSHIHVGQQTSVVSGDYKLVQRRKRGVVARESLYDWRNDPRELQDLSTDLPIVTATLAAKVARKLAESKPPKVEEAILDSATEERLRALGYID